MRTKEEILGKRNIVEFNMRCMIDFKFFCEEMLGLTEYGGIHDFQMEWFYTAQNNQTCLIEAPSGFSKTELMGVAYPLWIMYCKQNQKILLISKTIKQAEGNLLQRIKGYISDNEILKEVLTPTDARATWNKEQIRTLNGHWIVNVPFNVNIKGYRANYIILDESDSYEDIDIYFKHVPARLIPGGKIVLISTREGPTRLFGAIHARNPDIPYVKTVAIVDKNGNPKKEPYEEGFSIWPERFTIKYLLDLRKEIGNNAFEQNFMCNIMTEPEDAIFSIKSIIDSQDRSLGFSDSIDPNAQYFIGADFAISRGPKADMDAFVVIERKDSLMKIKHIEVHKGWTLPSKVNRLVELCEIYKSNLTTKVIADESNMGTMVINELRINGITVVPQNFHYAERKKLLQTFANILESRQFVIPRAPHDSKCLEMTDLLTEQLLGFMRKQSENTGNENVLSRAAHDDVAISTAMAAVEASKMKNTVFVGASAN